MSYNLTVLQGRVSRTPELKPVAQTKVCKFSLAVNRKYKGKEEVLFMDIESWGITAETAAQYLQKGSSCLVEGYLKQESWEKDCQKRSRIVLVCEHLVLLDAKKEAQEELPFPVKESMKEEDPKTGEGKFDFDELPF